MSSVAYWAAMSVVMTGFYLVENLVGRKVAEKVAMSAASKADPLVAT